MALTCHSLFLALLFICLFSLPTHVLIFSDYSIITLLETSVDYVVVEEILSRKGSGGSVRQSGLSKVTQLISLRARFWPEFCLPFRHHNFSASLFCCQRIFIWFVLKNIIIYTLNKASTKHMMKSSLSYAKDKMNKTWFSWGLENYLLAMASSPVTKTQSNIIKS